jgi:hypothetical protein
MSRFVRGLAVGVWLCGLQGLLPALAVDSAVSPCSIRRNEAGQLFPNSSLATRFASGGTESFFEVRCSKKSSGKLRLSIDGARTKTYNGLVQIRLVSANGIFSPATSEFTSGELVVPYSLVLNEGGAGRVMYQVQITANGRQLLQAARDYTVTVHAELLPDSQSDDPQGEI